MELKCLIVTIMGLQIFKNKSPIIISVFWPNSNWGFNGTHFDKMQDIVPMESHLDMGHLQLPMSRAVQD